MCHLRPIIAILCRAHPRFSNAVAVCARLRDTLSKRPVISAALCAMRVADCKRRCVKPIARVAGAAVAITIGYAVERPFRCGVLLTMCVCAHMCVHATAAGVACQALPQV